MAAVVFTVSAAAESAVMVPGEIEHVGASAGEGSTEHVRLAELVKQQTLVTLTVEVDVPPGFTVAGESAETESPKSARNVAVTDVSELIVNWQGPMPEQPPLHPPKP